MNQLAPEQTAHPAAVAQEFMKRADMKGGEVEAYAQTFNWLQSLLDGTQVVMSKESFDGMTAELKEATEKLEGTWTDPDEESEIPVLEPENPAEDDSSDLELDAVESEVSD